VSGLAGARGGEALVGVGPLQHVRAYHQVSEGERNGQQASSALAGREHNERVKLHALSG